MLNRFKNWITEDETYIRLQAGLLAVAIPLAVTVIFGETALLFSIAAILVYNYMYKDMSKED